MRDDSFIPADRNDEADSAPADPAGFDPQGGHDLPFGDDPQISGEEIDQLYRQALEAMEAVATDLSEACVELQRDPEDEADDEESQPAETEQQTSDLQRLSATALQSAAGADDESTVRPREVLEAALFVGGEPLTTKKLCGLLRGDFPPEFIEQAIDELNANYAAEERPYEIRLGEGGYRMVLRSDFESVRNRVYGIGPKEVRLSQEALEVLALVAYRQPISRKEIESTGLDNAGSTLRHLLRRELIAIKRDGSAGNEVQYHTTPRFLELFGMGDLDELPQADELEFK